MEKTKKPIFIDSIIHYEFKSILEYTVVETKKKYILDNISEYIFRQIIKKLNSRKPNSVFSYLKKMNPKEIT